MLRPKGGKELFFGDWIESGIRGGSKVFSREATIFKKYCKVDQINFPSSTNSLSHPILTTFSALQAVF